MTDAKHNFSPHFNLNQRKAFPCISLEKMREEEEQRREEETAGYMRLRTDRYTDFEGSGSDS